MWLSFFTGEPRDTCLVDMNPQLADVVQQRAFKGHICEQVIIYLIVEHLPQNFDEPGRRAADPKYNTHETWGSSTSRFAHVLLGDEPNLVQRLWYLMLPVEISAQVLKAN